MSEEQKRLLEKQLWAVANVLRGKMNADEYKNYILGFIFYKYLSEKLERYANEKLLAREDFKFAEIYEDSKDGKKYLDHIKESCIDHLGFFLKPTQLFSYLVSKGQGNVKGEETFILEDLKNILNSIEQTSMGTASEDDFKGLFDDVDLTSSKLGSTEQKKNAVIIEVLAHLSGIDFKLEDSKSDLLGDAYEYLIGEFAAGAGKKGGEFYTPAQVSRLLAQIVSVGKKRIKTVYDPTCGSGSLLLRLKDYVEVSNYFGQELNPTTYNLARMNMILHGVHFDHFKIKQGDTLTDDLLSDLKAEVIVANPPFAVEWRGEDDPQLVHDDRFSQYGRLAPRGAADYAFVAHMLYHLSDNGTMAVILPHGTLFRSGAEGHIRKYIIEKQNYLDAIIGLPSNLFYGAGISATVLVFKKCRKEDDDILFIDASKEFKKEGNQNRLTDENIKKIFETYVGRKEIQRYSHRAKLEEVKENEYNLNIPRYVDTLEEEEFIDIDIVSRQLGKLMAEEKVIFKKIDAFCDELKISKPNGNNVPLLKEYKKGIMRRILKGKLRFPKFHGEWKYTTLDHLAANKKYSIVDGPFGSQMKVSEFTTTGVPVIEMEHLHNAQSISRGTRYISVDKFQTIKRSAIYPGDILISKTGTIGLLGITTSDVNPGIITSRLSKITLDKNKANTGFIFQCLLGLQQDGYWTRVSQGGTMQVLGTKMIKDAPVPNISVDEQQKIADFLTSIDNFIASKDQQITKIE